MPKSLGNKIQYFFNNGNIVIDGECMLFPSYEQRDWNKFRLPVKQGDIMMTMDKRAFITNGKIDKSMCILWN